MSVKRFQYNREELEQYFDRIRLPRDSRYSDISGLTDHEKLSFLQLLQKHQLVTVPWENLGQHYSWPRAVSIRPRHLFNKIVGEYDRGGYCFEVNYFQHIILYSLGFDVYMSGSRMYKENTRSYGGWTHMVNLVTIAGRRYLLDSGFGPDGPTCAMPVEDGFEMKQIAPAEMKITYGPIDDNLDRSQKVWIFHHRYNAEEPWSPTYCFVDLEFTPADIESMNFYTESNPRTIFTHKVVAVRFSTESEATKSPGTRHGKRLECDIDGVITLNHDILKWRRHGKKVLEIPFRTEQDRLDALEKYFEIVLEKEDQEAILKTAAQIDLKVMPRDF